MLKVRNYYSFQDCLEIALGELLGIIDDFLDGTYNIVAVAEDGWGTDGIEKACTNLFEYDSSSSSWNSKEFINEFFVHLIMRFYSYFVYFVEGENPTVAEVFAANKEWLLKFFHMLDITAPKYTNILKIYKDNKSKLMDKLENGSKVVNRFNDTPQDGGTFDDDEHTTSITETDSSASTDVATVMARIKEIQDSYDNIMLLWSNEFIRLFIKKEQVL